MITLSKIIFFFNYVFNFIQRKAWSQAVVSGYQSTEWFSGCGNTWCVNTIQRSCDDILRNMIIHLMNTEISEWGDYLVKQRWFDSGDGHCSVTNRFDVITSLPISNMKNVNHLSRTNETKFWNHLRCNQNLIFQTRKHFANLQPSQ